MNTSALSRDHQHGHGRSCAGESCTDLREHYRLACLGNRWAEEHVTLARLGEDGASIIVALRRADNLLRPNSDPSRPSFSDRAIAVHAESSALLDSFIQVKHRAPKEAASRIEDAENALSDWQRHLTKIIAIQAAKAAQS